MLKQVLEQKKITTYKLAKDINEPYSSINDIVNGKVDAGDCKVKVFKKISDYLGQSMEETYKQCQLTLDIYSNKYGISGNVTVKHKKYYVEFCYDSEPYDIEICKVTEDSTKFITDVAVYEMEKKISQTIMERHICNMK